eukprot:jgi/Mesvir1/934/Mv17492-RA.1
MSKRLSTQRSLAAALSNENTSAAPAAASPIGPEGSGATSQALVVVQPPAAPASGQQRRLNPSAVALPSRVGSVTSTDDQRLKDNAIAIEVLQNTAGLTTQAVKDIAAKPALAGLAGDAPPITTWADMLKQHTTSTTSAVAAQLQRQTLDLREEAELSKRSLNPILKNFDLVEAAASAINSSYVFSG